MSTVVLDPLPVLYACQGCDEFGQEARELGKRMERAGLVQCIWLGDAGCPVLSERWPIHSLDGCARGCAKAWLERHGMQADQCHYVLP